MRSPTKQNLFLIEFSHQFPSSSHQLLLTGKRQAININLVSSPAQFVGTDDAILRSKNTIQLGHGFYNNNVYKVIIHKVHFGQNIFGWRGLDQGWPCGCGSMRFMRMMRICGSMQLRITLIYYQGRTHLQKVNQFRNQPGLQLIQNLAAVCIQEDFSRNIET